MYRVGEKIPDLFYNRMMEGIAVKRLTRKCPKCNMMWLTIEIALATNWTGRSPDFCPTHMAVKGNLQNQISIARAKEGHYYRSTGLLTVMGLGGYYRRRACPVEGCVDAKGKPTKWSSGEFYSHGTVVEDITICLRCGGRGKCLRNIIPKKKPWKPKSFSPKGWRGGSWSPPDMVPEEPWESHMLLNEIPFEEDKIP